MCNRPIAWREDPALSGEKGAQHRMVPVMCDEYVRALEDALMGDTGVRRWPDSSIVNDIRKSFNMPERETPDASEAPCPPQPVEQKTCPYCTTPCISWEDLSYHVHLAHPGQEVPGWVL